MAIHRFSPTILRPNHIGKAMMQKIWKSTARKLAVAACSMSMMTAAVCYADQNVTTPKEQFGHNIGDDYTLINYSQFEKYIRKLGKESPRMVVEEIGKTAEGRPQLMAIVTSPENHKRLAEYRRIAEKMARAENVTEEEARQYAKTAKAVVWIDGGLHATEVVGAHQLTELAYTLVSREDEETMRFLDDLIILLTHANPDGMELVSNWYMRKKDKEKRGFNDIPRLYQHYVGHDNNRDFYMMAQNETTNIARQLFREWYPVAMYNHHQTGPAGTMVFIPPFGGPTNHNINGEVTLGNQLVGLSMHQRLVREGKGGSVMMDYGPYTEWSNGILRASAYYHNMIGILTEINGHPTPMDVPFYPKLQLRDGKYPMPWVPGKLHFRTAIEYSLTQNYALLDYASRNRDSLLYNRYKMAKDAISKGNMDSWTMRPHAIHDLEVEIKKDKKEAKNLQPSRRNKGVDKKYLAQLRTDETRDPRGYIIPASQADFPTAVKFINALMKAGVQVERATADFSVHGKSYKAGSLIVKSAQAYRAQVLDMFEPQEHPDDLLYPGGPPKKPYDNAGYTLALQMGIDFDRVLEGFDGPFEKVTDDLAKTPAGTFMDAPNAVGYVTSHDVVNNVIAVNRLLKAGKDVYWLTEDTQYGPAGTLYMKGDSATMAGFARDLGLNISAVTAEPKAKAMKLNPAKVGLWDRYGGSMPSGWTRWILEQYEFSFDRVFVQELDKGKLDKKYDALVFVDGAVPAVGKPIQENEWNKQPEAKEIPKEYRTHLGVMTEENTIPQLKQFAENGKTILTIGSSANLAYHFKLPVQNHLAGRDNKPLTQDDFYIPPSILDMKVDAKAPVAYGIGERANHIYAGSPVFRFKADYDATMVKPIAWYDSATPLKSGWAWGQERLYGGSPIVKAKVGKGKMYLFGPEILFRAQSHDTFQFFFNGIYLSTATEVRLGN